jgi:hypothetical protein
MKTLTSTLLAATISIIIFTIFYYFASSWSTDIQLKRGDDAIAFTTCGVGHFIDPAAQVTETEFKSLLKRSSECNKPLGSIPNYHNPDGTQKHVVLLDNVCVINWELNPKGALKAFNEVCK